MVGRISVVERTGDFPISLHGVRDWPAEVVRWGGRGVVGRPLLGSGDPTMGPYGTPGGGTMASGLASTTLMARASSRLSVSDLFGMGEPERVGKLEFLLVGAMRGGL